MGYLHIDNLYKNQTIRLFRECREGRGEIVESKEARTAIGTSAAKLFKAELSSRL